MPAQLNSEETGSRTRVLRMEESVNASASSDADKLADAIRKSWIRERSNRAADKKRE